MRESSPGSRQGTDRYVTMTQKWFVSQGDRVYGPWSTDDVFTHRGQGNIVDADLIWGRGLDAWMTIKRWNPEASFNAPARPVVTAAPVTVAAPAAAPVAATRVEPQLMVARTAAVTAEATPTKLVATVSPADENTAVTFAPVAETPSDDVTAVRHVVRDDAETVFSAAANESWHFAAEGKSFGPYNRPGLIVELRRLPSLDGVVLWTKGMREWAGIHEFHDLAFELGVSQRRFARATIQGRAILKVDGLSQMAPLISISEGGLGLRLKSEYFAGQPVAVEIQSDALGEPMTLDAEVRYCAQGVVGLKFTSSSAAVRGRIAAFVKRAPVAKAA